MMLFLLIYVIYLRHKSPELHVTQVFHKKVTQTLKKEFKICEIDTNFNRRQKEMCSHIYLM